MKQTQGYMQKFQEMQQKLLEMRHDGKSGGGLVSLTIDGNGKIIGVKLDASILKPEDKELVEDLIVAAYNEAHTKLEAETKSGFPNMLDGSFKMPF